MKAALERREGHRAYLTVEVDPQEVEQALERAYRQLARRVVVPGFRPGRAPRVLVERRVGREAVLERALDDLLPQAFARAVEMTGLEPVDRPQIEDLRFAEGQPLRFRAVVTVRPEVELPDYRSLRVPLEVPEVTPEHVQQALERLREDQAALVAVEEPERGVQPGDVVMIDYRGELDGQPLPHGQGEGVWVEVGAGRLLPEFERELPGMRVGERKAFEVRFPEDDPDEGRRGKVARFEVTVREIKRKELPELDDEFARALGYPSLEELRRDVQNRLEQRVRAEAEQALREQVVRQVVDGARVDVPEVMVERRLDQMIDDVRRRVEAARTSLESYLAARGQTVEGLREQLRPQAERAVRQELVLDAVARREGIQASEDDVAREVQALARGSGRSEREVRRLLLHPDVRRALVAQIVRRKTVDLLADLARVEPSPGQPQEHRGAAGASGERGEGGQ